MTTQADMERAKQFYEMKLAVEQVDFVDDAPNIKAIATLIQEVRNETLEGVHNELDSLVQDAERNSLSAEYIEGVKDAFDCLKSQTQERKEGENK
jgi:L-lactate utilization protein LutB